MSNITGSSLRTIPPTESLEDIPPADGQEQHNNDEDEVSERAAATVSSECSNQAGTFS